MNLLIDKYFEGNWLFSRKMIFICGIIVGVLTDLLK